MLSDAVNDLNKHLDLEFHKALLAASLKSLEDTSNPLSFNNFCTGFRELIRHILSGLAPDVEIKNCAWYTPDETSKSGITRAHAITYVLHGGLSDAYVSRVLNIDVSDEKKVLISSINQLSKYTHVNASTFGVDAHNASGKAKLAIRALTNILDLSNQCRAELARALEDRIHNEVVAHSISETIDSVDELATHHCIEDIEVEEITVIKVDSKYVLLRASGTLGVELQWGSNSDLRNDIGAVGSDSFPFCCELQSHVDSPEELEVIEATLRVDTSSWWDDYCDEE